MSAYDGGIAVLEKYGRQHFRDITKGHPRRGHFTERTKAARPAPPAARRMTRRRFNKMKAM